MENRIQVFLYMVAMFFMGRCIRFARIKSGGGWNLDPLKRLNPEQHEGLVSDCNLMPIHVGTFDGDEEIVRWSLEIDGSFLSLKVSLYREVKGGKYWFGYHPVMVGDVERKVHTFDYRQSKTTVDGMDLDVLLENLWVAADQIANPSAFDVLEKRMRLSEVPRLWEKLVADRAVWVEEDTLHLNLEKVFGTGCMCVFPPDIGFGGFLKSLMSELTAKRVVVYHSSKKHDRHCVTTCSQDETVEEILDRTKNCSNCSLVPVVEGLDMEWRFASE